MGKRPDVKKKPFDGGFVDDDLGKNDGSFSAGPDDIEWEFRID